MEIPKDNPLTAAKVELGKLLFFDPRLSVDDTVACASCHSPQFGFSDGLATAIGVKGQRGGRSAPVATIRGLGVDGATGDVVVSEVGTDHRLGRSSTAGGARKS